MLLWLDNRFINSDHIVRIEPSSGDASGQRWAVMLTTGESFTVNDTAGSINRMGGAIIPAQPGFTLVEAFLPEAGAAEEAIFYRESTIIAFRVLQGGLMPIPITAEGETRSHEDLRKAVRSPTGQCVDTLGTWDSLDAFKADCERDVVEARTTAASGAGPAFSSPVPAPALGPAEIQNRPEPEPVTLTQSQESDPTAELRARILAEPIQAMSGKALWRDGQDFVEVIEAVRRAHPDVHVRGVGYDPQWGWKWGAGGLEKARTEMTDAGCISEFERALRFLSHAGHRFRRPAATNRKRSSYSWKHAAERVMGGYVSNGMLITAAYALGFIVTTEKGSPNAWINLSEEAISLDPGKGTV